MGRLQLRRRGGGPVGGVPVVAAAKEKGKEGGEEAEHARKLTMGSNRRGSGRREDIDAWPELR